MRVVEFRGAGGRIVLPLATGAAKSRQAGSRVILREPSKFIQLNSFAISLNHQNQG